MIYDKRRFYRIDVNFDVELFSQTKVPVGKGKATDISTSGIGVKSNSGFQFKKGTEVYATFKLPDETPLEKIRVEVRGVEKLPDGNLIKLRFTEMKVLDIIKAYIEKLPVT